MILNCDICNEGFEGKMKSQKRCSAKCRKEYHRKWMFDRTGNKSWRVHKDCVICGHEFFPSAHNQTMCQHVKCRNEYAKLKMRESCEKREKVINNISCIICKKPFETIGNSKIISCSKKCTVLNRKRTMPDRPYKKTPEYKIRSRIRTTLNTRIKRKVRTKDACGYTVNELKKHIESQFLPGMSWDTYGRTGWHIDHIKPLSAFQFIDEHGNIRMDQIRECMSLNNLQPLWWLDNIRKGGAKRYRENKS